MLVGFDGVEIHRADGYLIYQFLNHNINDRSYDYGGSIENHCNLPHEIVQSVAKEIRTECTAIWLSLIIDHNEEIDCSSLSFTAELIQHVRSC